MLSKIAIGLIKVYQTTISPFLGYSCRFYPSCSDYAVEALEKYGIFKGVQFSIRRICKCHPLNKQTGFDPLP